MLIVDDDLEWCDNLKGHLEDYPLFNVMKPVYTGAEAIKQIELHKPDAIVLDLILPIYDGIYIVEHIEENMPGYQPVIYIVSSISTEKTNRLLGNRDTVDSYSIKPIHPKSAMKTLQILLASEPSGQEGVEEASYANAGEMTFSTLNNLDWLVEDYLRKLGIGTAMLPTKCARVAIEICIRAGKDSRIAMMEIYKQAGQVFTPALSSSAVERNIRSAVASVKKVRTPLFEEHFPGGLTVNNGTFIQESANILRRWIVESSDDKIIIGEDSKVSRRW